MQIGEVLVLHRRWLFLAAGVVLEGQVPVSHMFTGVRTLLAQTLQVLYSGRALGLQGLPSSATLHVKQAYNGDDQAV
ncbi:MAG: hypothetical protein ACKPKO_05875, partial [Candidatus Fonsibacter sp.]